MSTPSANKTTTLLPKSNSLITADLPKPARSYEELGLCQRRKPACVGCTVHEYPQPQHQGIRFAPGVIDSGDDQNWRPQRKQLVVYTDVLLIIAFAILAVLGWTDAGNAVIDQVVQAIVGK